MVAVALPAGQFGLKVGQVVFEQRPVNAGKCRNTSPMAEEREADQGAQAATDCFQHQAGGELPAHPPFDQSP